jgi:phage tail-like protein
MDVNGSRYHLVLGPTDWLGGTPAPRPVEFADGALQLRRLPPALDGAAAVPQASSFRGAAADRYGNIYSIAGDGGSIRFLGGDWRASRPFWPAPPGTAPEAAALSDGQFTVATPAPLPATALRGIAVTAGHYLVVGSETLPGLLVFDLFGGGAPTPVRWPKAIPFAPFDLAATDDGGVWVLDRVNRRLWRLDRSLQVIAAAVDPGVAAFQPVDGSPGLERICDNAAISAGSAVSLPEVGAPQAVESLPDGSVIVLDGAGTPSVVHRYADGLHVGQAALEATAATLPPGSAPFAVSAIDMAFLPGEAGSPRRVHGTLYAVAADNRQAFAFDLIATPLRFDLTILPRLYPLREVTGSGLLRARGRIRYSAGDRWPVLAEYPQGKYERRGLLELPAAPNPPFDGKEPACLWHRVLIDGCIPPDARVEVESRASDDLSELGSLPWSQEPAPYLRQDDSELPFHRTYSSRKDGVGTWELLLQRAQGRYLQLRLVLTGRGRTTPRLRALRVYYPRFSYLTQYLPAAYRDDAESGSFLDRFLANVEGINTTIEGRIAAVQGYFDPRIVPGEFLPWLAAWLGVGLEATWNERTRRLFLANAARLFTERGTARGLVRAVRLGLDPCPDAVLDERADRSDIFTVRIVENFRLRRAPGVTFGDPTDLQGPGSTTDQSTWTPALGAEPLHTAFRKFLQIRHGSAASLQAVWGHSLTGFDDPALRLPAVRPGGARAADWTAFVRGAIGFTYAPVDDGDETLYREYLARTYRFAGAVNRAYGLQGGAALASFADIPRTLWARLKEALPAGGTMLSDWIAFVSQVVPTSRNAHRFTVLIPVTPEDSVDTQTRKRDLADRIVTREKPAHTAHEVRLYWGLFRVGEARLGFDTLLGPGSRSVALTLGRDPLGSGHLGFRDAERYPDRRLLATATASCTDPELQLC